MASRLVYLLLGSCLFFLESTYADITLSASHNREILHDAETASLYSGGISATRPVLARIAMLPKWRVEQEWLLPPDQFQGFALARFVDSDKAAKEPVLAGREGLYRLRKGQPVLHWPVDSLLASVDPFSFHRLDISRDINDDGLSDFVLPRLDGYTILLQGSDGRFTESRLLAPARTRFISHPLSGTELSLRLPHSIHAVDVNGDGARDVLLAREDGLQVYYAVDGNRFENGLGPALPIDFSVPEYSEPVAQKGRASLLSVLDISGDGLVDMVVKRSAPDADSAQTTEILLGARDPEGKLYYQDALAVLAEADETFSSGFAALGERGRKSFYRLSGELSATSVMGAFFRGGFDLQFKVYAQNPDGSFAKQTIFQRDLPFHVDTASLQIGPRYWLGDIDGDGLDDLLVGQDDEQLALYRSRPGQGLDRRAEQIDLPVSLNGSYLDLIEAGDHAPGAVVLRLPQADGSTRLWYRQFQ